MGKVSVIGLLSQSLQSRVENICITVIHILLTFVVPEEFQYDPVSKTYGDPTRRPEIKSSTIEFIAPSEYMVSCNILVL